MYPHGTKHAKHNKDATFAYQIVETDRTFVYDDAGKLLQAVETEDNYGTYTYNYEYDLMGNRTYMEKVSEDSTIAEWHRYVYNDSNQLVSETLDDGEKTTSLTYEYNADGNRISETGRIGTDKIEKTYEYTVENSLAAVYDADELLIAAAYDGDGDRVFQLNYNLHTDEDWKDNSGNGNGNDKDNNSDANLCSILFPENDKVSDAEQDLIDKIKSTGKQKNYELIEYINDVNREHTEVLVERNINGELDSAYTYGVDRLSIDRYDDSTGYYLYDPRGSVTGITNEEGQVYQSYRYDANGAATFGAPTYENEYTYNGEYYNPNIESQYLRARYYDVVTANFLTEDTYLGNIIEPLTLNRYNYCSSSPLNYVYPSGSVTIDTWIDLGILVVDGILCLIEPTEERKVNVLVDAISLATPLYSAITGKAAIGTTKGIQAVTSVDETGRTITEIVRYLGNDVTETLFSTADDFLKLENATDAYEVANSVNNALGQVHDATNFWDNLYSTFIKKYVEEAVEENIIDNLCDEAENANTIKWGIHEIVVRQDGEGYWGERISQNNIRVDRYELKINPQNESYYLPHPEGGYVQFENMVNGIVQDGKLIMQAKSFYHVYDMSNFAKTKILEEAQRQLEAANAAKYKVEWLVSEKNAVEQLQRFFSEHDMDIKVTFYPE